MKPASQALIDVYLEADGDLSGPIAERFPEERERELVRTAMTEPITDDDRLAETAQALIEWAADGEEPELVICVFCAAIVNIDPGVTASLGQTLLGIARSHLDERTSPELVACYHFADATIRGAGSAPEHFETLWAQGLRVLPRERGLWEQRFEQFALHLAYQGRLNEVAEDIGPLKGMRLARAQSAELPSDWATIVLFDAVECARFEVIEPLLEDLARAGDVPANNQEIIAGYETQFLFMRHAIAGTLEAVPDEVATDPQCQLLGALMVRDQKTTHACIEDQDYEEVLTPSTLFGYNAIRLALSLRDPDLAEDLLERRNQAGYIGYLDDFLRARIALLQGDGAKAASHFGRCLRAADHYLAHDRLEFELLLAGELTPIQTAWLGHRIESAGDYVPPGNPLLREGDRNRELRATPGHTAAVRPPAELHRRIFFHGGSSEPCLVHGPLGSGHLAMARELHQAGGRSGGPYFVVSCPALDDRDVPHLLHGEHDEMPGLWAQAQGGTLVFARIDRASPLLQAEISRVLEQRQVPGSADEELDCKVIGTSLTPASDLEAAGVNPELALQLALLPIGLPPLASLADNLPVFAESLIEDLCRERGRSRATLGEDLLAELGRQPWEGNLEELRLALHAALVAAGTGDRLGRDHLPPEWRS